MQDAKSAGLFGSLGVALPDNRAESPCLSPPNNDILVQAHEGFDRADEMPYLLPASRRPAPAEWGRHRGPQTDWRRVLTAEKGSLFVVDSRGRQTGASTIPIIQGMRWCRSRGAARAVLPTEITLLLPGVSGANWFGPSACRVHVPQLARLIRRLAQDAALEATR